MSKIEQEQTERTPGLEERFEAIEQILDQMEFEPKIAYQEDGTIKLMDSRIFRDEIMGLAND